MNNCNTCKTAQNKKPQDRTYVDTGSALLVISGCQEHVRNFLQEKDAEIVEEDSDEE